ncbi:YHS domain-containing protein [Pseudoduganella eburnea]|uniref:YHS domain-containing protein n=1 Tax=Massilia eburnea TaxID=1776165 RepID=A0A6L6QME3_9BURK|nr:DJ-1/PfpI family protein [Massilia eburnea]MTW13588.1 YHS domain-containing protein [Massilia eburnea]
MKRRELFRISTVMGLGAALPALGLAKAPSAGAAFPALPLHPPAQGSIPVAVLLSDNAVVIDFGGPWEVFSNVSVPGRGDGPAFQLYTVAATEAPITTMGGMKIVPNYTIANAPPPKVIVIPAQTVNDPAVLEWLRQASRAADLTMSVCTGAFVLAHAGLLDGKSATTHHSAFNEFAMRYPAVSLKRGARFVEEGKFATAGGLSSGIDLALRVVERYFGRSVASSTAYTMEYQGQGWLDPMSNSMYAKRRVASADHPICPVCEMDVDKASDPASTYRKRTYYFCSAEHKRLFDAQPEKFT